MNRASSQDPYAPRPEDHFAFGLWTVGHPGQDSFGEPVLSPVAPERIVRKLSELGAYGAKLHDDDLRAAHVEATRASGPGGGA